MIQDRAWTLATMLRHWLQCLSCLLREGECIAGFSMWNTKLQCSRNAPWNFASWRKVMPRILTILLAVWLLWLPQGFPVVALGQGTDVLPKCKAAYLRPWGYHTPL